MGTLRFLLAASVAMWHSGGLFGWRPYDGTACVNYFFVISGFYMAMILTEKYSGRDRLALFWSNRVLRLWPSFFLVSLIFTLLRFTDLVALYKQLDLSAALLAAAMNVTMVGYEFFDLMSVDANGSYYLNLTPHEGESARDYLLLGQGWSIGLEIWFYILAPFVVRWPLRTGALFTLGLVLNLSAVYWIQEDVWKYRFFPKRPSVFHGGRIVLPSGSTDTRSAG